MQIYSDEAGCLLPNKKRTPYFGLGGLVVPDSQLDSLNNIIRKLKEKHNYYLRFEYKFNNQHKVEFCRDLIDYYFSNDSLAFFILVFRVQDIIWSEFEKGDQQSHNACYSYFYKQILNLFIKEYLREGVELRLIMHRQSVGQKEIRNRFDYFEYPVSNRLIQCEERPSYHEPLLQFADLMVSSTVNTFTRFEFPDYTKCKVKNNISDYIMSKLGLPYHWNWRRVGETWGNPAAKWIRNAKYLYWERPDTRGTRRMKHKFDLFSWHGD